MVGTEHVLFQTGSLSPVFSACTKIVLDFFPKSAILYGYAGRSAPVGAWHEQYPPVLSTKWNPPFSAQWAAGALSKGPRALVCLNAPRSAVRSKSKVKLGR